MPNTSISMASSYVESDFYPPDGVVSSRTPSPRHIPEKDHIMNELESIFEELATQDPNWIDQFKLKKK